MKKFYLIAAAAAAVLAAGCAKNEVVQDVEKTPITFGVYTGRHATKTVSSTTYGSINTTTLLQNSVGFGVFAFYSDGAAKEYTPDPSNFTPNFMYNQLVEYTDTNEDEIKDTWTYSPIKYWPNEYNNTDAIGADVDKLTFFAYAPHVTTVGDEGITAFSTNSAIGDPTVSFKVPANKNNQIDLLWSDANTKNMVKPAIGTPVHFTFKHALSNLTIIPIAVVDNNSDKVNIPLSGGKDIAAGTLVKVNSITLKGQFNQEGTLNLATGEWTSSPATSDQTVTWSPDPVFDVTSINDKAEANTYYTGNPGVLPEFMFIPSSTSDKDYVITINYDFITTDTALSGESVTVHNVIHKTLENLEFEKGKKIKLFVGLGITSVVFDAEVANWTDDDAVNVWLPVNL